MKNQLLTKVLNLWCRLATMVFLFTSTYLGILNGRNFGVLITYVWGILAVTFVMAVAWIPLNDESKLSKKQMLIGHYIYFIVVNIMVWITGFYLQWFCWDQKITLICLEGTIIVVYIIMHILDYYTGKQQADNILRKLRERQEKDNNE